MDFDSQEKRSWVKLLLVKCPLGLEIPNCPLKEIRMLPLGSRMALVNSMSDEEIGSIIEHHQNCQKIRLYHESPQDDRAGSSIS